MWVSLPFAQIARPIGHASRATSTTTTAMTIARRRPVRGARGAPLTLGIGRAGVDAVRGGFDGRGPEGPAGAAGRAGRPTGTASSAAGGRDWPAAGAKLGGVAGAPGRGEPGAPGRPVGLSGRAEPPVRARDAGVRFSSSDGIVSSP